MLNKDQKRISRYVCLQTIYAYEISGEQDVSTFSNGKIKSTTEYKKNLMTGAQKIYSPDGNLISHALYLRSRLKEIIK